MREGVLVYDERSERMDIRFGMEEYYGGLHCGECLEVELDKEWVPTRIEMDCSDRRWYLVGIETNNLQRLKVRV
ncbi:DUF5348 domain-containing protein [Eubacterium callanderi]|uniref:DUF5348 domain-containing protein n=1 Tax=Eubacterium callanderi TaxID=53442 RepID=UPI0026710FB7|nr:DUF5348 domain-containing protein [Eubacterium callanderi]